MTRKKGREIGPGERYFEGSLDNAYRSPKAKKEKGPLGLGAEEVGLCHINKIMNPLQTNYDYFEFICPVKQMPLIQSQITND